MMETGNALAFGIIVAYSTMGLVLALVAIFSDQ